MIVLNAQGETQCEHHTDYQIIVIQDQRNDNWMGPQFQLVQGEPDFSHFFHGHIDDSLDLQALMSIQIQYLLFSRMSEYFSVCNGYLAKKRS